MKFLDTNIFLRYISGDDPVKAPACRTLLRRIESGDEVATTSESVIAEVAYVLRSNRQQYGVEAAEIGSFLRPILALPGLKIQNKETFLRAFDLWEAHPKLDFEDVLSIAHMERLGISEIVSYDREFDGVAEVRRVEPEA